MRLFIATGAAGVSALLPTGAGAACRLALLLAMDISSSVDGAEDRLQRQGLARALTAPAVREAFLSSDEPVALALYEWSGRYQQRLVLPWALIATPADLDAAAARIAGSTRSYSEFPTAMGYAIGYAASVFAKAPDCLFRTLDISGDGVNNDGFGPDLAYSSFPLDGVTVNGLPVGGHDPDVYTYYEDSVIRGPGAFVERAEDFTDFERAMRRKLIREIGARAIGAAGPGPARDG